MRGGQHLLSTLHQHLKFEMSEQLSNDQITHKRCVCSYLMTTTAAVVQAFQLHEAQRHFQDAYAARPVCTKSAGTVAGMLALPGQVSSNSMKYRAGQDDSTGPACPNGLPLPCCRYFLLTFMGGLAQGTLCSSRV